MKKVVLIGAGPITEVPEEYFEDSYLVACDGGYRLFEENKKEPDLFVGDFDTLPEKELKSPKKKYLLNPIKDDTDTFFAIKKLLEQGYKEFHLFGCLGGKMEHSYANIQVLSYLLDHDAIGYLYSADSKTVVTMVDKGVIHFKKEEQGFLSLFSYTLVSKVSEKHLKYELDHATLTSSIPLGVSNEFIGEAGEIDVEEGRILLFCPREALLS